MKDKDRLFSARRMLTSLAIAVAAGALAVPIGRTAVAWTVGWIAGSGVLLAWVWILSWRKDGDATRAFAANEGSNLSTDALVLLGAGAGVGVVVDLLVNGAHVASVVLGVVAATLSWALINSVYAFHYARLYYVEGDGGIDFNQKEPPSYSDFAYMAFTIGASFAVSDNTATNSAVRKAVLAHALLSYFFGTLIIATVINLVTNLGH
jgi:uncharacterized membrane protein